MQDFRRLRVWHEAMQLGATSYRLAETLPPSERYGLRSQMTRSAVSVASNIAEGCGRDSDREFRRFLKISYGSACELETQARLALRVELGSADLLQEIVEQAEDVRRMLSGLIQSTA